MSTLAYEEDSLGKACPVKGRWPKAGRVQRFSERRTPEVMTRRERRVKGENDS